MDLQIESCILSGWKSLNQSKKDQQGCTLYPQNTRYQSVNVGMYTHVYPVKAANMYCIIDQSYIAVTCILHWHFTRLVDIIDKC